MFVRIKKHRSKKGFSEYAYTVNNIWTNKGARQRVAKYLGKVITIKESDKGINFNLEELLNKNLKEFIIKLLEIELIERGFNGEQNNLINSKLNLSVNLKSLDFKTKNGKKFVIRANEGFICGDTIRELIEFIDRNTKGKTVESVDEGKEINREKTEFEIRRKLTKDLASKVLEAGIPANENYFIIIHDKMDEIMKKQRKGLNKREDNSEEEKNEFYY